MMVGYEKDWLSLSPYALHYWEKLLLEPYSYARDVAYIVVAPDNDFVINRVRGFFKELSTVYEVGFNCLPTGLVFGIFLSCNHCNMSFLCM